jgi:3-deoxy-D-manno-octulosonic-acid transferase
LLGWIRNLIYGLVLVLALPWIGWRRITTGRYKSGVAQKLGGLKPADLQCSGKEPVVWFHGVSVGEVQLLRPVVEHWQARHPTWKCVVSTTTESGMALARQLFPSSVGLFYFPLDFTWAVSRTLAVLEPKLLVLGELELWPNLIDQCRARGVPVAVINGRLSPRSFARYQQLGWLTRGMFRGLSLVAAQSESNAERFRSCGAAQTTLVTGSLKFDNVAFDRQAAELQRLRALVGVGDEHRVWVMGSTQVHEELPAVLAFQNLRREFPTLKLIVVPRHPERFDSVAAEIDRTGLKMLRRSRLAQPVSHDSWDVLLVDTVGELKWWWGLAEIAIVGGSFGRRGGQNMLEPAAYGANVAFGPNTTNFRDIVELLLGGEAATRLSSLAEIEAWVRQQLQSAAEGQARGARARDIIMSGQGALQRTLDALEELLRE